MGNLKLNDHMIRDEIEKTIKELKIDRQDFAEVSKIKWHGIIKKMVESFVRINDYKYNDIMHWAWEKFKEPSATITFDNDDAYKYLTKFIDDDCVWFLVEDEFEKYWLYEAKTKFIPIILAELPFCEYYVASKKYDWLICENHHGRLFGVGESVTEKFDNFLKIMHL